jgi:hypothetical protein
MRCDDWDIAREQFACRGHVLRRSRAWTASFLVRAGHKMKRVSIRRFLSVLTRGSAAAVFLFAFAQAETATGVARPNAPAASAQAGVSPSDTVEVKGFRSRRM